MKRILASLLLCSMVFSLTACESETNETTDETSEEEVTTTTITGYVVDIVGNEITLQLLDDSISSGMTDTVPEITEGELPEGVEEGDFPDDVEGTVPGITEGELPEGVEAGDLPDDVEGTIPGITEGELPEGVEEGDLPDDIEAGMTGTVPGMESVMGSSMSSALSEETVVYTIPIGATVYSFGTTTTFTQISEESYVTITFNENGVIIEVSVVG